MPKIIAMLCVLCSPVVAQNVIPFASYDNSIELLIDNRSSSPASVVIGLKDRPDWMHFVDVRESTVRLSPNSQKAVDFPFSVDRTAPIRQNQTLSFVVSTQDGQSWTKEFTVSVSPPRNVELLQNYPNPLNPSTTIGFQMPEEGRVSLKVYNILGQEVAVLLNGDVAAGYHEERWNASSLSSGIYVCRLVAEFQGRSFTREMTMTVLR